MNSFLNLIPCAVLCFLLVGCGGGDSTSYAKNPDKDDSIQWTDGNAPDRLPAMVKMTFSHPELVVMYQTGKMHILHDPHFWYNGRSNFDASFNYRKKEDDTASLDIRFKELNSWGTTYTRILICELTFDEGGKTGTFTDGGGMNGYSGTFTMEY